MLKSRTLKRTILSTLLLCISSFSFAEEIDLATYEKTLFSLNGEDGVLAKIFNLIQPRIKYLVELGSGDGQFESNTALLKKQGWNGLLLDRAFEVPEARVFKEFITAENLNELLSKYLVPGEFDLLSIDTVYNAFYFWQALDESYKPSVVVIHHNATHLPFEDKVVKYRPYYAGDDTNYFGASILALRNLGRSKGYSLVHAEKGAVHLFFIRDDILETLPVTFKNANDVEKLYRYPSYWNGPNGGRRQDPRYRAYITSAEAMSQRLP